MKRIGLPLLLALVLILLPGCWSWQEIGDLHIVAALGVDAVGDRIRASFQVVRPEQVKLGGGGEGGGGGAGGGGGGSAPGPAAKAVWVGTDEGATLFEASRNMVAKSEKRLYFAHTQVMVFGEEAARRGVRPYLDLFLRNRQGRPTIYLMTVRGKAEDALHAVSDAESIPAMGLVRVMDVARGSGLTEAITLQEFVNRLLSPGIAPIMTHLELYERDGQKHVRIVGVCVYRGDKLVGHLTPAETRGMLWVRGRVQGGVIVVPDPRNPGRKVSLETLRSWVKVRPRLDGERARVTVEVTDECILAEERGAGADTDQHYLASLERRKTEVIRREITAALRKARSLRADVFGFGEAVHRRYPKVWRRMAPRWQTETFPRVEVEVKVKARLLSTGLTVLPPMPGKGGGLS